MSMQEKEKKKWEARKISRSCEIDSLSLSLSLPLSLSAHKKGSSLSIPDNKQDEKVISTNVLEKGDKF